MAAEVRNPAGVQRWRVGALWLTCLGLVVWCVVAIFREDSTRSAVAALYSLFHLVRFGSAATVAAMAARRPAVPRRSWIKVYALAWLWTAMQSMGCVVASLVLLLKGISRYPLFVEGVALSVPLFLAAPLVPMSIRVNRRRFDGPDGPGPLAPA